MKDKAKIQAVTRCGVHYRKDTDTTTIFNLETNDVIAEIPGEFVTFHQLNNQQPTTN